MKLLLFSLMVFFGAGCTSKTPSRPRAEVIAPDESLKGKKFSSLSFPCTKVARTQVHKELWVFDLADVESPHEKFTAETLQGLVNKKSPQIWLKNGGLGDLLLTQLEKEGWVLHKVSKLWELVDHFRDQILGAIVYSTGNESVNIATSLSGIYRGIIIEASLIKKAQAHQLPILENVEDESLEAVYEEVRTRVTSGLLVELPEYLNRSSMGYHLRDFAVQNNIFTYYFPGPHPFRTRLLRRSAHYPLVFGWGWDEGEWVKELSRYGGSAVASDYSDNLSALACLPVSLPRRPNPPATELSGKERLIAFVISDGDNITWFGSNLAGSKEFWQHPLHGKMPLTWEISPLLNAVAPRLARYYFSTAKGGHNGDNFIAASSGLGYNFANIHPDSAEVAQATAHFMRHAKLSIASMMHYYGDYTSAATEYLKQDGIAAVIVKNYHGYHLHDGAISFVNNKPLITVKGMLWENFPESAEHPGMHLSTSPEGLVSLISEMPANPEEDLRSFGVIVVHAWSWGKEGGPLNKVRWVKEHLPAQTKVVSVEELVRALNFYHKPAKGE